MAIAYFEHIIQVVFGSMRSFEDKGPAMGFNLKAGYAHQLIVAENSVSGYANLWS